MTWNQLPEKIGEPSFDDYNLTLQKVTLEITHE
jgi:hypothetical protein